MAYIENLHIFFVKNAGGKMSVNPVTQILHIIPVKESRIES